MQTNPGRRCVGQRLIVLATLMSIMIAACTPSPEKICAKEADLSPFVAQRECVDELTAFHAEEPAKFESYGRCVLESKNIASLGSCNKEFHPDAYAPAPLAEAHNAL